MAMQNLFLIEAPPASLSISLCKVSLLQGWNSRSLRAPFWRCYCPLEEGGLVRLDGLEFPLIPGQGMLIAPYTNIASEQKQSFHKAYCHFQFDLSRARFRSGVYPFVVDATDFSVMKDLSKGEDTSRNQFVLMSLMIKQVGRGLEELPRDAVTRPHSDQRIWLVRRAMKRNLDNPLVNAELAELVGLQESSFVRYYTKATGEPPQRYYRRLRLEHACDLLLTTDETIDQVAERCGFWDRNHFTKAFSRQWYTPPAEFRCKNRL